MSYYRFFALPVLFASSFVANAGDTQAILSHCAKTALSERVTQQTAVRFKTKLSQVSVARAKYAMANQTVKIDLADSKGEPIGIAACEFGRTGKMVSATLYPKLIEVAGI